jgi:ABC-type branched-subunit amino acid transport system substrate-binding protein/DNA-binding beta-propeller fold protein YncE
VSSVIGPGSTFAGYQVESLVGRGGMGVVFRAIDLSLERPVALKLIAPDLAEDERFRARFLKEPRLAASLEHPNVIPIYDAGDEDGQLYLAMRYVEGTDLKSLLAREGTLTPERALALLSQVAAALDAAHGRDLVHRDVKPANVLLDRDEHVYLTDFGISKKLGGASTDTGHLVGSLDYLAPEQIRGEAVDGRTDAYALACVLYECLAGAPPFRRATEAETLWAHIQEQPPSLDAQPALDSLLRRALAKRQGERPASCAELVNAAAAALGIGAEAITARRRLPLTIRRRGRLILAAGLVLVAVAGVLAFATGGDDVAEAPVGNGVAAIDASGDEVASFIESGMAPSNVAFGEGAVWVLDAQDDAVARIDPETREVTGGLKPRGTPTDIAAGAGAVWVGNGGGRSGNFTLSISRFDPASGDITHTQRLPTETQGSFYVPTSNEGYPNIAVGEGAVWARNPDGNLSRIDADTGRLVEEIDVFFERIAAGKEGVWLLDGPAVTRINPRTNRPEQTIRFGALGVAGIAVGAGSVWVTAEQQGVVWRIEPGPAPLFRTIDVGVGVTYISYGAGAVWTANYIDGTVSRIDPDTNTVTAEIPIGAAQALAAGAGSAWVSTAGATRSDTLPASVCSPLESGAGKPDVLVASDLPLQGPLGSSPRAIVDAIRTVLRERGFKAGRHTVGYRSCDNSTAQTGNYESRRCAANANAFASADDLVALIGPYNSPCAAIEIPILNRAPSGPLAMISPTNTYPGLTRSGLGPPDSYKDEPEVYYPTGVRNYARVRPRDDLQGVAHGVLATQLGLRSVYVIHDGSRFWKVQLADPFRRTARRLGVAIAGSAAFDATAQSYESLAAQVERSGADGVLVGGDPYDGGDRLLKALRARLGEGVTIMGGSLFAFAPDVLERAGSAAIGLYATTLDLPLTATPLTAEGRRFAREVGALSAPLQGVLEAGQATELVLDAIARSDGTRESVLHELRASRVRDGIIGTFRFDRNGDMTPAYIPLVRITGTTPPGTNLPSDFQGAVVDRVLKVPAGAGGED